MTVEMDARLEAERYVLISAWIKSMRLSLPIASAYYYTLLARTPKVGPAYLLRRLMIAAAEDSFDIEVQHDILLAKAKWARWTTEQKHRRLVLLSARIADGPNSYNTGTYGLAYDWTKEPKEPGDSAVNARKKLRKMPLTTTDDRRRLWERAWGAMLDYANDESDPKYWTEIYAMFGRYCIWQSAKYPVLYAWADAIKDNSAYLSEVDQRGGYNWWSRGTFIATNGPAPSMPHTNIETQATIGTERAMRDLARGKIKAPIYAYDGRHCHPYKGIADERFAGTRKGLVNMFAMARRDGRLDPHAPAAITLKPVPDKFLAKPYITLTL